ncbi:MAG: Gfo/Idh/MocA family oxidoreductase [Gammaproteobacteria bacterium]
MNTPTRPMTSSAPAGYAAGAAFDLDSDLMAAIRGGSRAPLVAAVVGAGRWGRIMCAALCALSPAVSAVHLVARRNLDATAEWAARRRASGALTSVRVIGSIDALLRDGGVDMAVVTRLACEHGATVRQLLLAGVHVLVEKPFVATASEARALVELARSRGLQLAVGYEFMYALPMHRFRQALKRYLGDIRSMHFEWFDVRGADKWGERKDPDPSMNVVCDLYPHVLSELALLFGPRTCTTVRLTTRDGFDQATIQASMDGIDIRVDLDKNAGAARRRIVALDRAGRTLELDYTTEPGWIGLEGALLPVDPLEDAFARSLETELAYFIARIQNPNMDIPNSAAATLPIVESTQEAESALVARQAEVMRGVLHRPLGPDADAGAIAILRRHLIGPLLEQGLIANPKDAPAVDAWAERALRIVHAFSRDPWTLQSDILAREKIDKAALIALNACIRGSPFAQHLMIQGGLALKYWQTILPLVRSGSIAAVAGGRYQFPVRVGIYAAVSCMFRCSFCGRVTEARYPHGAVGDGNAMFDAIFSGMAADGLSTLSLGGGLEPLTNARIDEVIHSARRHGLKVPLVTNGYMLTPKYAGQHPALFDLDVLRVSLYGVDDESYRRVTGRAGAFGPVRSNVVEFLKERNRRGSRVKFGFNFIVLINTTDQVLRVLDVIREINAAVDNGPGVDFLTLREDFSVPDTEGLTSEERAMLVDIFARFEHKRRAECPNLEVDYGYALYPLSQGVVWKPLAMVTAEGMYPRAYPQLSVAVDILGDVYLYRDAAFLNRPGADRYIIGRATRTRTLESIIRDYLSSGRTIAPAPDDPALMDAFDHVVTKTVVQCEADAAAGIGFDLGPIEARVYVAAERPASPSATRVNYWERLSQTAPDAYNQR